jgi:hypothetical protein
VRLAVDVASAGPADPFPTVALEGNGLLARSFKALVENVEHLEKRHMLVDVVHLVGLECASTLAVFLPPHIERDLHYL